MSFDWSEYLTLAREILAQQPVSVSPEARARNAISRAYYAAFVKCRNRLRDEDHVFLLGDATDHRAVIDELKNAHGANRQRMGHDLWRLRKDRNRADYDDRVPAIEKTSVADVQLAVSILSRLSQL